MPVKPRITALSATSVEILNAIRNSATQNYQNFIPIATPNTESIKEIGAIIMQYPTLQNEFLNALVNRIGRVIVTSKMYDNPWVMFKKGMLEFGETIEDIFVNIAKPFQYDPAVAETNLFKREIPDVRATFHIMNYQKYYKSTVSNDQLRQAFLTWQGITDLIAKIVDAMYTGANYDEFLTMKYMLAKHIINGHLYPVTIPAATAENAKEIAADIKGISNKFEFLSTDYNLAGVQTHSVKNDQFMIVNSIFDAVMDVNVLATSFNMDKAEFLGHRVMINSFGLTTGENDRLALLFADDPTYVAITPEESTALNAIPAVLIDRDWFMVFDNFNNFTEQYNGEGLYWNYWYHVWKTFSVSPFANSAVFVPTAAGVTSVSVSPKTATVNAGQNALFSATVVTTGFAPKAVDWSITGNVDENTRIDNSGNLFVSTGETATTITVKATSVFDPTKNGTATVTVNS